MSAEQVRTLEAKAAKAEGVSMFELMSRAGEASFQAMLSHWPEAKKILVFAGNGNNGGDAYIVATLAQKAGLKVTVVCENSQRKLLGDGGIAQRNWLKGGGACLHFKQVKFVGFDLIVDGLLGTGITGNVTQIFQQQIQHINQSGLPILALDVPSGLDADTGQPLPIAIQATTTVSFIGVKSGLITGRGKHHTGELIYADLGIGKAFYQLTTAKAQVMDWLMLPSLGQRPVHANKGTFGKLLCIGGNAGMAGAIRLTAEAALRAGSGMVKVYCHSKSVEQVAAGRPEIMLVAAQKVKHDLAKALDWATAVAIGPGLGQDIWADEIFSELIDYLAVNPKPLTLDADALNLLANHVVDTKTMSVVAGLPNCVVTPHSGEGARLLETHVNMIEQDRYKACIQIAKKYQVTCVLKGAGSLITGPESQYVWVCKGGNPGMATAGMGDVLTGIIAGLLSQYISAEKAAAYGVCIHAEAGDRNASESGQRGMMASDLFLSIRNIVNE